MRFCVWSVDWFQYRHKKVAFAAEYAALSIALQIRLTQNKMKQTPPDPLDRMQFRADPLADDTMAAIMGRWPVIENESESISVAWQSQRDKIAVVTREFANWTSNEKIARWQAPAGMSPEMATALAHYTVAGATLPACADQAKIQRAEALFVDYGVLSVTILFCASLPECYVIPDLSAVLHATGQLEKHTDYRIRATGAMIFPVMMHGGLTTHEGGGIAQVFKVRLIHATVRNLILRNSPQDAQAANAATVIAPLEALKNTDDMHQVLFAHGWDIAADGLPCNQEELAYTLLTFSYVFLKAMRTLGLGFSRADEEAYLHTWNVTGHMLGIDRELMADTYDEAAKLFARMQARGREDMRANPVVPDPRPKLGNALIEAMQSVIPISILKPIPLLITRHLVGDETSRDLGLTDAAPLASRVLFKTVLNVSRVIDAIGRVFSPGFSITRMLTRVLGYRLITKLLMSQTRKLKLPTHVLDRADEMLHRWSEDGNAPRWINNIEDRFTTRGSWSLHK
jgi:ER-bound oxygenase mpaB/B'/Rubber oxygenase, catalytic domain